MLASDHKGEGSKEYKRLEEKNTIIRTLGLFKLSTVFLTKSPHSPSLQEAYIHTHSVNISKTTQPPSASFKPADIENALLWQSQYPTPDIHRLRGPQRSIAIIMMRVCQVLESFPPSFLEQNRCPG